MSGPEGETGVDDTKLPDTPEVDAQRERRKQFDEEWTSIGEVLATILLEPLIVSISTKPGEDEAAEVAPANVDEAVPRTSDEMADEISQILNSTFSFT